MTCEKRIDKELYGEMCDVKYIKTYTELDFKDKFGELYENGYRVLWRTLEGLMLRYKYKTTDIVILTCKQPIKKKWYETIET
jgi:hypothetical protein